MGDARHQIGAGPLIGGVLLPLLQQVALHVVKGGAHGGKLVPALIVHRRRHIPLLHPLCPGGEGIHRAHDLPQLIPGKDHAEQPDDPHGRQAADKDGDEHHLRLGAVAAKAPGAVGVTRMGQGHQQIVPRLPAHQHHAAVLDHQGALLRPGGVLDHPGKELLLTLIQAAGDDLPVPADHQVIVRRPQPFG